MNIIEQLISLIAVHRCVSCGVEGAIICDSCTHSSLKAVPSRCYRCHAVTKQSQTCRSCKASTQISHVWIAAEYQDIAKKAVYKLKFDRAKAVSKTIAEIIDSSLPRLPADLIICHIPTANKRVRMRGYDQAQLIARHLATIRKWQHQTLLIRTGKSRQVGAGRKERFRHLEQALRIRNDSKLSGKHILLVDDVTTTGATIEAATKILKKAGAKTVDVAVFAQP